MVYMLSSQFVFRYFPRRFTTSRWSSSESLYNDHIVTSDTQKLILGAGSALTALADPWRADMVAVNGEVTGLSALKYMHKMMLDNPEGCQILSDKPRISGSTMTSLASLPLETIGHAYYQFMDKYNISPDSRTEVRFVDDPALAYVMTRYRETHDLTHCMLDMPTNMVGEVLVKWVEALQFGLPMCSGGAIFGPLRFKTNRQRENYKTLLPWAIDTGRNAHFLLNVFYEQRWEQNIEDFRKEFNIKPPPISISS